MAFQGNAAYQLDGYQTYEVGARGSLSVHEGGISTRARYEAAASLTMLLKAIVVCTLLLGAIGAARVLLTVQTVSILNQANEVETAVGNARDASTELKMERSVLTSTDRIQRIATENYGMVYASEIDTIVLRPQGAQDGAGEAQSSELTDVASPEA